MVEPDRQGCCGPEPVAQSARGGSALTLALAEKDHAGFHRQTEAYAAAWPDQPGPCETLVMPARQQFDVVRDFCDPQSQLSRPLVALARAETDSGG